MNRKELGSNHNLFICRIVFVMPQWSLNDRRHMLMLMTSHGRNARIARDTWVQQGRNPVPSLATFKRIIPR